MKIKLKDVVRLHEELNGVAHPQTGQVLLKGLLNQELHFKLKYHLTRLSKEVEVEFEQLVNSEKELFKKHFGEGEVVNSPEFRQSEEFLHYSNERFELFQEEIDFKDFEFSIDEFDFKTSDSYPGFIDLFLK